jgi:hypothetical protein
MMSTVQRLADTFVGGLVFFVVVTPLAVVTRQLLPARIRTCEYRCFAHAMPRWIGEKLFCGTSMSLSSFPISRVVPASFMPKVKRVGC